MTQCTGLWDISEMAELSNIESINERFGELKKLIDDVKSNMMSGDDCNNQFYTIIQTLDNLVTSVSNLKNDKSLPSDEYTILQTNILEVRNELSRMNKSIDETICGGLKELMIKLTEKVNRLEILTNNAGIDQQVVMNATSQIEKSLSAKIKETSDMLYSQGISATDTIREDVSVVNGNMKECVEYLEKTVKAVSDDAVQHVSDDLTVLGTTIEKTTDNLKRSIIDIFTRIQEAIEQGVGNGVSKSSFDTKELDNDFEMLKNGIYNLNVNTEQKINQLSSLVEELDVFKKLESFSKLKDLPAIGDLKHTLENNINRIVDEYSYTLQSSQNRDELNSSTQQFRKDVYNEIVSMLSNVSEYLIETEEKTKAQLKEEEFEKNQIEQFSEKIDELTSVTELNNSGYDNIQIELKDIREKCASISEMIEANVKKSSAKRTALEESMLEIKNDVQEIQLKSDYLKKQSSEIGEIVRECSKSIIESSEPDRNNIKNMLSDIKKNISILQSGDEETDYTYSMQDIESDIAKIRIYLNELNQNGVSVNSDEFSDELNSVVVMVDSMKQQLNKIDECDLSDTMAKMKDDVTSISTRVNKLLLTSDSSSNMIESSLKEFKLLSTEIDEQIKSMADSSKFKTIEDELNTIKKSLEESSSYNNIINQSLIMLAEWVDSAGETITNIFEKQSKLDALDELKELIVDAKSNISNSSEDVVSSVKSMLEETNTLVKDIEIIDYKSSFDELEAKLSEQDIKLEKQEERLNKIDEKLTTILEMVAKNDSGELSSKINDIDLKMEKLNRSIEKLTSYVNED